MAQRDLYAVRWSRQILEEAERNLIASGYDPERIRRRFEMIRTHFADGEVLGYEDLIDMMKCDTKDRHVLAAAVRSSANQIVTMNLRDFPEHALEPYSIEAVSPDTFFLNALDLAPKATTEVIREQIRALKRPPLSTATVLAALAKCGAPQFAQQMETILAATDQDP